MPASSSLVCSRSAVPGDGGPAQRGMRFHRLKAQERRGNEGQFNTLRYSERQSVGNLPLHPVKQRRRRWQKSFRTTKAPRPDRGLLATFPLQVLEHGEVVLRLHSQGPRGGGPGGGGRQRLGALGGAPSAAGHTSTTGSATARPRGLCSRARRCRRQEGRRRTKSV